MKKLITLMFMSITLISSVGCHLKSGSNQDKAKIVVDEEKLLIEKRIGTEDLYEDLKEITDMEKVEKASNILKKAIWINAKVEMVHPPDYEINNKYFIWLTPQKDMLEVFMHGENKYTKLSNMDSEALYEIITEEKLVD